MTMPLLQVRLMQGLLALVWLAASPGAVAQTAAARDPTIPPRAANQAPAPSSAASTRPQAPADPLSVVVRDGQPHLVVGTRLVAPGQAMAGTTRLERITETEIWISEGKRLHKLPRYPGVVRRLAADGSAPACITVGGSAPASPPSNAANPRPSAAGGCVPVKP